MARNPGGAIRSAGAAALLVLGLAAHAHAQSDDDRARVHFDAGVSYYEQARYDDAVAQFLEAYRLSPRAELLVNASRAYERGGKPCEAADLAQRYVDNHADAPDVATMRERARSLRQGAHCGRAAPGPNAQGGLGIYGVLSVIGLSLGGAALGVSLGTGLAAEDTYQALVQRCGEASACTDPADVAAASDGALLADLSTGFFFAGAALAAIGLVFLIVEVTGSSAPAATSRIELVPSLAGLTLRARW